MDHDKFRVWFAGFLDAQDAKVFLMRRGLNKTRVPVLSVSHTDMSLLNLIRQRFSRGRTYPGVNESPSTWVCIGTECLDVVRQIRPYLMVRGQVVECILTWKPELTVSQTRELFRQFKMARSGAWEKPSEIKVRKIDFNVKEMGSKKAWKRRVSK